MAANHINQETFNQLINAEKPVLVDFWAPWCVYCRRIAPAYDQIADLFAGEIEVVKVNIDEEPKLAKDYRIEVIPTLMLFRDGEDLGSIIAPDSKAAIEDFIRETLAQ